MPPDYITQNSVETGTLLMYIGLSMIPVIIWSIVFYKKDSSPSPIKNILFTFFVGCFTVTPLLLYQHLFTKYYDQLYPDVIIGNVFYSFVLNTIIDFFAAIIFLAVFLAIIMAIISIVLSLFHKQTLSAVYKSLFEETSNFTAFGIFILIVIGVEILLEQTTSSRIVDTLAGTFVLLAVMEEYVKHLVVRYIDDHRIKDIDDAIVYSVMVGLAFAFAENIKYFLEAPPDQLFGLFIGRSLFSVFAHVLFSGIFGYYYGVAHFANSIYYAESEVEGKIFHLPRLAHRLLHLKSSIAFREQKMMEGLVLSTVIHTIFNILLELGYTYLIVPYLAFGYLYLSHLLAIKENQKQYGVIGSRALPEQEYEKLIWKISSIKWAEKIRKEREEREGKGTAPEPMR